MVTLQQANHSGWQEDLRGNPDTGKHSGTLIEQVQDIFYCRVRKLGEEKGVVMVRVQVSGSWSRVWALYSQ
jgi:hypothetical protein